ncbi:MAG: hypothetical protein JST51_20570 [Armatimonadetes bacterium]|nr:hypothetical protein [Armatimonadota bacterium]
MSYSDWIQLIRNAGAEPRLADQAWLQSQFQFGTSPAMVANSIKSGYYPRPQQVPIQPAMQQPTYSQGSSAQSGNGVVIPSIGKFGIAFVIFMAVLSLFVRLPHKTVVKLPRSLTVHWEYNGPDYSILRIKNKTAEPVTNLKPTTRIVVQNTSNPEDGYHSLVVPGEVDKTTIEPGEVAHATFRHGDIPNNEAVDATDDQGNLNMDEG